MISRYIKKKKYSLIRYLSFKLNRILRMGFDESTADDLGVSCNSGVPLPRGAVEAGTNKTGDPLYAGRAFYNGDLLPAKINPKLRSAYVSWGGMERATSSYEVRIINVHFI